jgi:23S rRNA (uridine2552-2'-O)-methyltransferase
VLDLGAAPGSWSLYASTRVGPRGTVVAVDLQEIPAISAANVTVVRADVLAALPAPLDGSPGSDPIGGGAPYDVVLSDMAPSTTGSKVSDQARSHELFMKALDVAVRLGRPGAAFVGKIFMSGDFALARRAVAAHFEACRIIKPEGTRANSSEIYLVGVGLSGSAPVVPGVEEPARE